MNTGTNSAYVTNTYDPHTGKLTNSNIDRTTTPTRLDAVTVVGDRTPDLSWTNRSTPPVEVPS